MAQTAEITNAAPLPVMGRLVRQPFGPGATGYTTVIAGISAITRSVGLYPNPDGSGVLYYLQGKGEALTTAGMGCALKGNARGSTVGVAFMANQITPYFDVVIDGVAYPVVGTATDNGAPILTREDHYACTIFADLDDGPHDIAIVPAVSGVPGVDYVVPVYGLLVEERFGGRAVTPVLINTAATAVPVTATSIPTNATLRNELRGISRVDYVNTDTGAQTVTIELGGVTIWSSTIPAGGKDSWVPPGPVAQLPSPLNITHKASVASKINSITYGPYQ